MDQHTELLAMGLVLLLPLMIGCASVMQGATQQVPISSRPGNADVIILDENGNQIARGLTPFTASLDRGSGYFQSGTYEIHINKDGYRERVITLDGTVSTPYLLGNFVLGGLIGWVIIDPATGAMWTLDPEEIHTQLAQKDVEALKDMARDKRLVVMLKKDVPEKYRNVLKRVE